ncbi:MAG: glycoside hydrolase family 127 protein [Lachnospiraceae bacterium]|nr:glycoside hydrolase family 127 protein [Lachnospiraceae bacterium]
MQQKKYQWMDPVKVKPQGWLKKQLQLQAEGLSGNLDKIWPDIRDSRWIGGDREGWERVPYWLDGFIPLAYLLDDEDLKARAKKYIDAILERQQEDGWICPCTQEERANYDVWAAFLICKVLVVYENCSKDERIEQVVYDVLKQLLKHISMGTLFDWGAARWFECLIPLTWLYERRPEPWMTDLAFVLEGYGVDYEKLYRSLSFDRPVVNKYWTFLNHVVNVAMAIKSRAEMSLYTGEDPDAFAVSFYNKLMEKHSMATGHFTGDECLAGDVPIQGSECCSVTEAMYSYEELLAIGGNPFWGDLLEQEAYNGLATTISADMWTHQYDQQTNQVECTRMDVSKIPFTSNGGDAHTYGLEPNYGCCTANFNQGWPKFAWSCVMQNAEGLSVMAIAPVEVSANIAGANVTLNVDTQYPFRDAVKLFVNTDKAAEFAVSIRIPGFAKAANVTVDGLKSCVEPGTFYSLKKVWEGTKTIEVEFIFEAELVDRPYGMKVLRRGPLFYSVPIASEWEKIEYEINGVVRKFPYCDYDIRPVSEWRYGFASDTFTTAFHELPEMPFDREHPAITLEAQMYPLDWQMENNMCKAAPESLTPVGEKVSVKLQPYGCTTLRMTEMPFIK